MIDTFTPDANTSDFIRPIVALNAGCSDGGTPRHAVRQQETPQCFP